MAKKLCIREEYTGKNGEPKVSWKEIGTLFEGKKGQPLMKLHHIPGTLIHVFDAKKKEGDVQQGGQQDEFNGDVEF